MAREYVGLTTEATYWVRDPGGRWWSVSAEDAAWVLGSPMGGYAKLRKRRYHKPDVDVALLAAMPLSYKAKSDVERGMGIVLWDWALGTSRCIGVSRQVERLVGEALQRAEMMGTPVPEFVRQYVALEERLCEDRKNNPSTTAADLTRRLKF